MAALWRNEVVELTGAQLRALLEPARPRDTQICLRPGGGRDVRWPVRGQIWTQSRLWWVGADPLSGRACQDISDFHNRLAKSEINFPEFQSRSKETWASRGVGEGNARGEHNADVGRGPEAQITYLDKLVVGFQIINPQIATH